MTTPVDALRARHLLPLAGVLAGLLACSPPTEPEAAWQPSEGAHSATWEEAQEVCGLLLERAQVAALSRGNPESAVEIRAPYDLCMRQQGWALRDEADENTRLAMQEEVTRFLDREVAPRRTKEGFTSRFGAPQCQPADATNEICVWFFDYASSVAERSYPTALSCLLPVDGSPRLEGTCQMDAK